MKKVMIFVPFLTGYGGTESVISNLFDEYNKQTTEFDFRLSSIGGTLDSNWMDRIKNKNIIKLSNNKLIRKIQYLIVLFFVLQHQVRKYKPDVVISNSYIMWFCLTLLKKVFGYKYNVLAWYHFSLDSHKIPNLFLKAADGYLVISTGIKRQLEKRGVSKNKIHVIYNPIVEVKDTIKRSNDTKPVKFIYIGRIMLYGQKNMHEMLDALSNTSGRWFLDIYGVGNVEEVEQYAQRLGILEKINFKGFLPDVWGNIKTCDALILTSVFEGLPMVLNEAVSHGIPIISSNCDTGPEDIVTEQNGFLYDVGNVKELTNILQKFINRDVYFYNIEKIKKSINKFYSINYFDVFIKSLQKYTR